jgi:hypothetical protein
MGTKARLVGPKGKVMFSKDFLLKVAKESVVTFVGTAGSVFLAFGDGLEKAALVGGVVAGVRAVIGAIVKNVGTPDTPHL